MQFKSLQMQIAAWAGMCLLLSTAIIVGFAGFEMRRNALATREKAIQHAKEYAREAAQHQATEIQVWLAGALDTARTLAQTLSGVRDENIWLDISRQDVNGILKTILAHNPDFVGVYTAWEPDAFDKMDRVYTNYNWHSASGRFVPYWGRNPQGDIEIKALENYDNEKTGDYYQLPKQTRDECIIEPYIQTLLNRKVFITSLVVPILTGGEFRGIVGIDLRFDHLQNVIDKMQELLYEGNSDVFIISHEGTIVAASGKPELSGEFIKVLHEDWQKELNTIKSGELVIKKDEGRIAIFAPLTIGRTKTPWSVNILIPMTAITAEADAQKHQALMGVFSMFGVSLICTAAALGILWMMSRDLVKPIRQSAHFATQLANGDLSAGLQIQRADELGTLATALRTMQERLNAVSFGTGELIQSIQQGQLGARGKASEYRGSWRELVNGVNGVVEAFQRPFQETVEYLQQLAQGEIPKVIHEQYLGDFDNVRRSLNRCIEAISGLTAETETLTQAAIHGRLTVRGDSQKFGGEYAAIVEGINRTLSTLVGHFDQLPTMILIMDRDFRIQYVNNAGAELAGLSREQIIGQYCYELYHTDDCGTTRCCSAKAMQSGELESGENISRPSAGKEMFAAYSSVPIRDQNGTIVGALENVLDQTESKLAMRAVEQQNWMRSGQAELSEVMRGEQDITTLAQNIISYLAQYFQADIGAIYLASTHNGASSLRLAGAYAYTRRKAGGEVVKFGQGFVGQTALEQESIIYSEVPEDYLLIKTEHSYETPQQLLMSPFFHEEQVKGVIEIGTSGTFTNAHVDFLKQVSESIAVAFHSAETRQEMQELLEHSQQQAEELQVQAEELQAQAEELQAQNEYQS